MDTYDVEIAPDAIEWLALDEAERVHLVKAFHVRAGVALQKLNAHAVFHVIVENQIALADYLPAREALQRLRSEGLSRHDAVHAIASVLAGHLQRLAQRGADTVASETAYVAGLRRLTAERWRAGEVDA